jgi:hypothetical protein
LTFIAKARFESMTYTARNSNDVRKRTQTIHRAETRPGFLFTDLSTRERCRRVESVQGLAPGSLGQAAGSVAHVVNESSAQRKLSLLGFGAPRDRRVTSGSAMRHDEPDHELASRLLCVMAESRCAISKDRSRASEAGLYTRC